MTVRLDFDASTAGDGGAVVVLDARKYDFGACPAQHVHHRDYFDLFRSVRYWYEDALRFRGSSCRESICNKESI